MEIQYLTGDATRPVAEGNKIIAHICNDIGKWGKGFVLAISKRWPRVEAAYRGTAFLWRGTTQIVEVEDDIIVANMIAQKGIYKENGVPPIRYEKLRGALSQVHDLAKDRGASVHMPRIGCGLAGGKWDVVSKIIQEELTEKGVPVFVYDLPSS